MAKYYTFLQTLSLKSLDSFIYVEPTQKKEILILIGNKHYYYYYYYYYYAPLLVICIIILGHHFSNIRTSVVINLGSSV